MKMIRDYLLQIKENSTDNRIILNQYGVKNYYISTVENAKIITNTHDTFHGIQSLAIYNLVENTSSKEMLDLLKKVTGVKILNLQLEEQRNIKDDLYLDDQQRARRLYAFTGKVAINITDDLIAMFRNRMKNGSLYEAQVQEMKTVPFWTKTYYYYNVYFPTTEEGKIKEAERTKIVNNTEKKNSKKGEKIDAKHGNGGKGGQKNKWGSKDEIKLSSINYLNDTKEQKTSSSMTNRAEEAIVTGMDIEENTVTTVSANVISEMKEMIKREMADEVRKMIKESNEKVVEELRTEIEKQRVEDNKIIENRINDSNSMILYQMKKDKEDYLAMMMQIMNGKKTNNQPRPRHCIVVSNT